MVLIVALVVSIGMRKDNISEEEAEASGSKNVDEQYFKDDSSEKYNREDREGSSEDNQDVKFFIKGSDEKTIVEPLGLDKEKYYSIYIETLSDLGVAYMDINIAKKHNDYCTLNQEDMLIKQQEQSVQDWQIIWGVLTEMKSLEDTGSRFNPSGYVNKEIIFETFEVEDSPEIAHRNSCGNRSMFCYDSGLGFLEDGNYSFEEGEEYLLVVNLYDSNKKMIYTGNPSDCGDGVDRLDSLNKTIRFSGVKIGRDHLDCNGVIIGDGYTDEIDYGDSVKLDVDYVGSLTGSTITDLKFYYQFRSDDFTDWGEWTEIDYLLRGNDIYWRPNKVGYYQLFADIGWEDIEGKTYSCLGMRSDQGHPMSRILNKDKVISCNGCYYGDFYSESTINMPPDRFQVLKEDGIKVCARTIKKNKTDVNARYFVKLSDIVKGQDIEVIYDSSNQDVSGFTTTGTDFSVQEIDLSNYELEKGINGYTVSVEFINGYMEDIDLEVLGIMVGDIIVYSDGGLVDTNGTWDPIKNPECDKIEPFESHSTILHCGGHFEYPPNSFRSSIDDSRWFDNCSPKEVIDGTDKID